MAREAQYVYWEHFRRPIDYYLIHHLFEALYYVDDEFRKRFEPTPWRSSHPPSSFARVMLQPYDVDRYDQLLDACFVHKLRRRAPEPESRPNSLLAHLMRGDEPAKVEPAPTWADRRVPTAVAAGGFRRDGLAG